jgi:hypothetical protein
MSRACTGIGDFGMHMIGRMDMMDGMWYEFMDWDAAFVSFVLFGVRLARETRKVTEGKQAST